MPHLIQEDVSVKGGTRVQETLRSMDARKLFRTWHQVRLRCTLAFRIFGSAILRPAFVCCNQFPLFFIEKILCTARVRVSVSCTQLALPRKLIFRTSFLATYFVSVVLIRNQLVWSLKFFPTRDEKVWHWKQVTKDLGEYRNNVNETGALWMASKN